MNRYLLLAFKIISFLALVAIFQIIGNMLLLAPLLKVPEIGDFYGLITIRPSEVPIFSMFLQFLGAMIMYSLYRMKNDTPALPFFRGAGKKEAGQALWGTALGALLILALAATLFISGLVSFDFQPFSMRQLAGTLALTMVIALAEEAIFRGYILQELLENMDVNIALTISALIFALVHFSTPEYSWLPVLNLFLSGLLLGLAYLRFNSIWAAVGLHFSWNFVQGPVMGFKVSGNTLPTWLAPEFASAPGYLTGSTYGLEGTLIATLALMATIAWLYAGLETAVYKQKEPGFQPQTSSEG